MEVLETVPIAQDKNLTDFRFPCPAGEPPPFRFSRLLRHHRLGLGKTRRCVKNIALGKTSRVKQLINFEGPMPQAFAGQTITITLDDEIDISRGDMLVKADDSVSYTNQLTAHLVWMAESPAAGQRIFI